MELLSVLWMIVVIFALAKIAGFFFKKIGMPGLIGEIIVGILLANLIIGDKTIAGMFGIWKDIGTGMSSENFDILNTLAQIGVMFLLFAVGLETRVKELLSVGKTAFMVALLGVVIPFILGFVYVEFIFDPGNIPSSLFLGAAMVATSVGITARVIKDLNLTNTKESKIIIGAAVIDDVLGMIVLAIVKGIVDNSGGGIGNIILITVIAFVFVILWLFIAAKVVPVIYKKCKAYSESKKAKGKKYTNVEVFAIAIIVCFGSAVLAEFIGLAAIIGSFLAGVLFSEHAEEFKLGEKVEALNSFLVPFFFVVVGIQVNLSLIRGEIVAAIIVVIVLAILGKYIGCMLGAKIGDKTMKKNSLNIIGVGMIPRGEVGIIVATIGLDLIGKEFTNLYSIVVLMSVVTTIIAPPILARLFRKEYPEENVKG